MSLRQQKAGVGFKCWLYWGWAWDLTGVVSNYTRDCFGDVITSLFGYYVVVKESGSKFVFQKYSQNASRHNIDPVSESNATQKWPWRDDVKTWRHFNTMARITASGNVASMREPLDGSLWWYWIAANAAKKNGASFKNYHRLSHLFYLCGVQIRQSLLCNMRDWSQG